MNARLRKAAALALASTWLVVPVGVDAQTPPGAKTALLEDQATWALARPMQMGRVYHTATLLPNGKVLIAGGRTDVAASGGGFATERAELYDPSTGIGGTTGSMHSPRAGHVAILLASGKVLVLGEGSPFAEIYDPAKGTWSDASDPARYRHQFSATLLASGKVLVAGGFNEDFSAVFDDAELYDPASNTWAATASLGFARYGHDATLLSDGRVLVVGGFHDFGDDFFGPSPLGSATLYDSVAQAWTPTGSVAIARSDDTETPLADGTVLLAGGVSSTGGREAVAEIYDRSGTWRRVSALNRARSGHTATLLPDGRVLIAGGLGSASSRQGTTTIVQTQALTSVQAYDPTTGTWTDASSLNVARAYHTATPLPGGSVLVTGGVSLEDGGMIVTDLASMEIYLAPAPPADIPFRITALFSDQAGFFQFIVLQRLATGSDAAIAGRTLTVASAAAGIVKSYVFPNPPGPSPVTTLCLATRGLGSGVYPDYVIPDQFLPTGGGTIDLAGIDAWSFGPIAVTGVALLNRDGSASFDNTFTMPCSRSAVGFGVDADPVVEYYNAALDHYFLTAFQSDIDALDSGRIAGWARTGESFSARITRTPLADSIRLDLLDVCRYYIPPAQGDSHFYSASASECAAAHAQHPDYQLESASAFLAALPDPLSGACPVGATPIYRLWNGRVDSNHRYTTSLDVRGLMLARGYVAEGYGADGVAFCE